MTKRIYASFRQMKVFAFNHRLKEYMKPRGSKWKLQVMRKKYTEFMAFSVSQ